METAFKVFRFVHGYVIISNLKSSRLANFALFAISRKNVTKIRNARSEDAEKADYFLCSSTVYENVLLSLFQALVRNGKAESQLIEKFFLH